jgi:hypothetical protein
VGRGAEEVLTVPTDVGDRDQVEALFSAEQRASVGSTA